MSSHQTQSRAVIELNNVHFRWPSSSEPTLVIDSLTINQGEHAFIKGPSGCGKSTLLSLLTGINQANQGQVTVLDTQLSDLSSRQRDRFRADHIGYIFQQFNLLPYLNVLENVTLPCQFSAQRKRRVKGSLEQNAKQLLERLHLPKSCIDKPVVNLSIGQQQRVAAARALIGAPALIIADEPTSSLDYDNRSAFIELLQEQIDEANATLLFVSHDPTLEPLFDKSIDLTQLNQARGSQ